MGYKDLQLGIYKIHNGDYDSALAYVRQEMKEREGDAAHPSGYGPNADFKKALHKFHDDYKELGNQLIASAQKGGEISRAEYLTLDRAEKLFAEASSPGPQVAAFQLAALNEGMSGSGGRSMTAQLKAAMSLSEYKDPTRELGTVYTAPTRHF